MKLTIGYLYGDVMNIYGDTGNIIALQYRAKLHNIETEIKMISIGSTYKTHDADILFFGGGQDASQIDVAKDLQKTKGEIIKQEIERGIPLLSICGGYQLLGEYYQPSDGEKLPGIGIFGAYTIAGSNRMIGNIVIDSSWGKLIGFENHSGKTFLNDENTKLGSVLSGYGNNGEDQTEGCVYKNAIGCYMHGSLLPKNPALTDWFIKTALQIKYNKDISLNDVDSTVENKARKHFLSED